MSTPAPSWGLLFAYARGGEGLCGPAGPCSGHLWEGELTSTPGEHTSGGQRCRPEPQPLWAASMAPLLGYPGQLVSAGWYARTFITLAPSAPQLKARRVPRMLPCRGYAAVRGPRDIALGLMGPKTASTQECGSCSSRRRSQKHQPANKNPCRDSETDVVTLCCPPAPLCIESV